jgi:hypothetical protein
MITKAADRLNGFVVCLPPDGSEPLDVQEAIMKVDHYADGTAYFTPDNDIGFASTWRHPTQLELRKWLRKHGNFRVELELHSKTIKGHECITFKGTSERFFWSEIMTHREASRNASSARAIPYKRMKAWILNDPAMPIHWGSNRAGMQSGNAIHDIDACEQEILELLDEVYERMDGIVTRYDLHKEILNRFSECWSWINWVISFPRHGFHNMLSLRCTPHAHPNYQRLAVNMARLYRASTPLELQQGEWHLPMVTDIWDWKDGIAPSIDVCDQQDLDHMIKWSVARSAWTSYMTVEEKIATDEEAYRRHDECVKYVHATPTEHQNRARADSGRNGGTMPGYDQYRHMIPNESCGEFDFSILDTTYRDVDYVIP